MVIKVIICYKMILIVPLFSYNTGEEAGREHLTPV